MKETIKQTRNHPCPHCNAPTISAVPPTQATPPSSNTNRLSNRLWSTVASATQPAKQVKVPPKPPTNKMINEFKSAKIIIRVPVDKDPCAKLEPKELTCKINAALLTINAKIDDNLIQVKGASRLPSGDLLIHTYNRIAARWILENCHCWTEIVHKDFTTMRPTFPVLLQSVPTKFNPADPNFIKELANQNHLPIEVF
ncbi:hypothetical protein CROQUDRAFT_42194, partial [Cronartium quercuum f. sp. fusiforme G11]